MRREGADILVKERPQLLLFCGAVGLIGNLAPLATFVLATVVAQHDIVSDTISDLARGPHKWIMDGGFYMHAAGLLALAIASAHTHLGRTGWSAGLICLALLALVVVLLGLWDELQPDAENSFDMTVHTKLTFLLGPLYLAGPILMARGAATVHRGYGAAFLAASALWIVFAIAFKLSPTAYDGIVEKTAVAATMFWTSPLAFIFLARGYSRRHRIT